jgi:DNA-binding transcriptional LysR family regulator
MKDFPLETLGVFVAIARAGGLSAAARELGVSKATVSKHLSQLETWLGVALMARTTRTLTLTDAGRNALARARRIMDEAEALAEEAALGRDVPRGPLKVAVPGAFGRLWLGDALVDFMRRWPLVALEIWAEDRTVDLVAGGFDAALRIGTMPDSSLLARRIAPVRPMLVAAPSYWAAHGRPEKPEDLSAHACLRYANAPDNGVWRFTGPDGRAVRVNVAGPMTCNGGEMEMPALLAGLGVALLPDFLVCHAVREGKLSCAMTDWRAPELTLHLLTPPGRARPKRLEVFRDFIVERFAVKPPVWSV